MEKESGSWRERIGAFDDRIKPSVKRFEQFALVQVAAMIGAVIAFAVVCVTAWQIWVDLDDRKLERQYAAEERQAREEERTARREERIDRAWERLHNENSSDLILVRALNHLFSEDEDLHGIEIDCIGVETAKSQKIGVERVERESPDRCVREGRRYLSGFDFKGKTYDEGWRQGIIGLRLNGVILVGNFETVDLSIGSAIRSSMRGSSFENTQIEMFVEREAPELIISDSSFTNSELTFFGRTPEQTNDNSFRVFAGSNLSGSVLPVWSLFPAGIFPSAAPTNWAWADTPPLLHNGGDKDSVSAFLEFTGGSSFSNEASVDEMLNYLNEKITLVEPPTTAAGKVVPLGERKNPNWQEDSKKVKTMSLAEARESYPAIYADLIANHRAMYENRGILPRIQR